MGVKRFIAIVGTVLGIGSLFFLTRGLLWSVEPNAPPDTGEDHHDGFFIPHDMPDGQYSIDLASDGNHLVRRWSDEGQRWQKLRKRYGTTETTILVDDDTEQVEHVAYDQYARQRLPLPRGSTHCVHYRDYGPLNYPLIQADYYASKRAFFNWCDLYPIVQGHVSLALDGNVAVYVCQRQVTQLKSNTCSEAEFRAVETRLNATCGLSAGYTFVPDWNKEYGRAWRGERTCRRWGKYHDHVRGGPVRFTDRKGRGKMTKEPKGMRDPRLPHEVLQEALWEPERPEYMADDGVRANNRMQYGEYTPGWYNLWMTMWHNWDKSTGKLPHGSYDKWNKKIEKMHRYPSYNDTSERRPQDPPSGEMPPTNGWIDFQENMYDGSKKKKKIKFGKLGKMKVELQKDDWDG